MIPVMPKLVVMIASVVAGMNNIVSSMCCTAESSMPSSCCKNRLPLLMTISDSDEVPWCKRARLPGENAQRGTGSARDNSVLKLFGG